MAARKQATKTAPKAAAPKAAAPAPEQGTGPLVKVDWENPAIQRTRPGTARYATLQLALQYDGKPLADLRAAWLEQAKAGAVHAENSKFTLGTSKTGKKHQEWGGWLGYLTKKSKVVTLVQQ